MRSLRGRLTSWRLHFKRVWPYVLSGLLILASTGKLIAAENVDVKTEDCWRVLATCQVDVAAKTEADVGDFQPSDVLGLTDYNHYMTYKVVFQGELKPTTDTSQFIYQVAETLADNRGWVRAGYVFSRVQLAAQADFNLVLIQAKLLDSIPGCSSQWSCRAGTSVYINEDRWNGATSAWNSAGGNLRDYRHMVINHEVGHWLGHDHYHCSDSSSNLAPVMQQQSIDLEGCKFNPWPLNFEIEGV